MTVSNPTNVVTYTGNGVTTIFPFSFLIPEGTAVLTLTEIATGVESAEISSSLYTITGEDNPSGGSITYPLTGSPVSASYYVNIKRLVDIAQSLDLTNQSSYLPELLEDQLDLIVMMIAQLDEMIGRAILVGPGGATDGLVAAILGAVDDTLANAAAAAASETAAAASAVTAAAAAATFTAATTTEILTGTNATKFASADAIAALWEKGADIASAGTLTIGEGGLFHVTGTTTITDIDFGTAKDGRSAILIFDGILTLTYNATTLKMPGNASIITAAGDRCVVVQENADNVIIASYTRADGTAVVGSAAVGQTSVASATTTDIGAAATTDIIITGTTTITGFGTAPAGTYRRGYFSGALTLTYNATSLILPGAATITTVAGDSFTAVSLGSGNWKVMDYTRGTGAPVKGKVLLATLTLTSGTTQSATGLTGYKDLFIEIAGASSNGTGALQLALSANNGSSYTTAVAIASGSTTAAETVDGVVQLLSIDAATPVSKTVVAWTRRSGSTSNDFFGDHTVGAVNALQLSWAGALTFDAGVARIYGSN